MTVDGRYTYILFCNNGSPLSKLRSGQCVCVCGGGDLDVNTAIPAVK